MSLVFMLNQLSARVWEYNRFMQVDFSVQFLSVSYMTDSRVLFDEAVLEQKLKVQLDIQHGFVKEVVYHWMEKPHVGADGQQDGAIFKAAIVPLRPHLLGSTPDSQEVRITFEAVGYYHHGSPRHLKKRAKQFLKGPAKAFLDTDPTHRYLDVSDAGAVEPGHYSIDVFIRCIATFELPKQDPETRITHYLAELLGEILKVLRKF